MVSIKNLMLKEHARLHILFHDFEKSLDYLFEAKIKFAKLKWNMQKHFFVEEQGIFEYFPEMDIKGNIDGFFLVSDHSDIIEQMKVIEDDLDSGVTPNISFLKNKIETHRTFEDNNFYPKLDQKLSLEQKQEMAERIREIIKQ
jgi:hemerythrin-like domain-containing protein